MNMPNDTHASLKPSFLSLTPAFLLTSTILLAVFRAALLLRYADAASLSGLGRDIVEAFWRGARFDLKLASVVTLLWLMPLTLLQSLLSRWPALIARLIRLRDAGLLLALCAMTLVSMVQYYYFGFYQTPFTPVVFGLAEDDTVNVLRTVWEDYPVIRVLLGVALLGWAANFFMRQVASTLAVTLRQMGWFRGGWKVTLHVVLVVTILFLSRGSLATFPLNKEYSWFSTNPMLNHAVRNASQSLYDAWRMRDDDSTHIRRADDGLKKRGFDNVLEAASIAAGHPVHSTEEISDLFWRTSPSGNSNVRPHVVFVLMESWGGHLLSFDDAQKTDLLGRLRPLTRSDYWFRNFLPSQGGTHASMEALLLNSPVTPLTLGKFRKTPFDSAVTWPFKQAGYQTILVTGGSAQWRDIRDALRYQGFDKIYDKADILARYPDTRVNDWGALDEYLFRFAYDVLQRADHEGRHVMLLVQTTTNHPPFQLPGDRHVPIETTLLRAASRLPPETVDNIAQTYRYSSDQLGGFMNSIKSSGFADRTLVGAAGDHNMRYVFDYKRPRDSFLADFVASYLYVPAALQPKAPVAVDVNGYYSHQDMFPTFMALALPPGIRYFAGGENIFAPKRTQNSAYCWYSGLYAQEGYAEGTLKKPTFFKWDVGHQLTPAEVPPPALLEKFRRGEARLALQDWWIRSRALGQSPGAPLAPLNPATALTPN